MTMRRSISATGLSVAVLAALTASGWLGLGASGASAAQLERDFLSLLPAGNYGFVAINSLSELDKATHAWGARLKIEGHEKHGLVNHLRNSFGLKQGLREDGTFALFCLPFHGGVQAAPGGKVADKAAGFGAVPVTDEASFLANFADAKDLGGGVRQVKIAGIPGDLLVRVIGKHAIFTETDNRELLVGLAAQGDGGLAGRIAADRLAELDGAQVAAWLPSSGINAAFNLLERGFASKAGRGGPEAEHFAQCLARARDASAFFAQADGVIKTFNIDEKGLRSRWTLLAKPDTNLAKWFGQALSQPKPGMLLAKLPAGQWLVAGGVQGHTPDDEFVDALIRGTFNEFLVRDHFKGEELARIESDLRGAFKGLNSASMSVFAPSGGRQAGQVQSAPQRDRFVPMGFLNVDDSAAYLKRFRAYHAALGKVLKAAGATPDALTENAEKVGDLSADRIDLNTGKTSLAFFAQVRKASPDGRREQFGVLDQWWIGEQKLYLTALDDKTVLWTVGDRTNLEEAVRLARLGGPDIPSDNWVRKAMDTFPKEPRAVLAINPKTVAMLIGKAYAANIASNQALIIPDLDNPVPFAATLSYSKSAATIEWAVDGDLIESAARWFRELDRAGRQPAGRPNPQ
jgi:hypothetical protein